MCNLNNNESNADIFSPLPVTTPDVIITGKEAQS